jgi:orotidine 5''-phosphate decarboxylase, subfamily 1
MQSRDRLIVALDRSSREEILRLADQLQDEVGLFKIGLQAFLRNGPSIVEELSARGAKIFLDLKIHDIPNTASEAVKACASMGVAMTTVHAAGGAEMMRACTHETMLVLGVTVLTSLDAAALAETGVGGRPLDQVARLAALAQHSGLRGVVASPQEIALLRERCGRELIIVTPGIRPAGAPADDQLRTKTPAAAVAAGADYIVVGRPITDASDPRGAALALIESLV